ncbi:hypothetical protein [Nocardiopsis sp. CNT312]|uniref:hypothetical protein n=1 Tax=Nocardiopsis sp. CNT312 TaxID=1137268 RepID=UPI00048C3401|nr:hypothetical protein [Nocardiopsis sp. CNT312]
MPPGPFGSPPPPGPPRMGLFSSPSGVRAALLNLSGLGVGYAYLKRWLFFGVALAVTVGLLVGAALHGAADHLLVWVPVLLVWFVAASVHGLFAGRARDERTVASGGRPARRGVPVWAAAGVAVAVLAAFVAVWQVGEWRLRVADAAHARGECGEAVGLYGQVEAGFQLSMNPSLIERARDGVEACGLLTRAQDQVASEYYDQALDTYSTYFDHPASRWEDTDGEVAGTYFSYARTVADTAAESYTGVVTDEIREGFQRAYEIYSTIPEDYSGTEVAGQVPEALVSLYDLGTGDYAEERWCAAFDQIEAFAGLDWSAAPEVADRIDAEAPDAALKCGWAEVEDGSADTAQQMADFLAEEYPGHEAEDVEDLARHVGAAHLEEEMDALTAIGESDFDPVPIGGGSGDKTILEITNDSQYEMRFLYVGEDGVHDEVTTPACDDCEEYSSQPTGNSCFERGGEVMRLELEPGEYRVLLTRGGSLSVPLHGTVNFRAGDTYDLCYYVTTQQ